MIPFGPTKDEKDGAWRGGAAFVGAWAILWFLGLLTPLPLSIVDPSTLVGSFITAFAIIGAFMSAPFAWLRIRGGGGGGGGARKGHVLYEIHDPQGNTTAVYHPDGPKGWSPPLNKGISRSLDSRTTIWREISWVAPVTVGDVMLTAVWNVIILALGRAQARGGSSGRRTRTYDDGLDEANEL